MERGAKAAALGALVLLAGLGAGAARDGTAGAVAAAPVFGSEVFVSTSVRVGEPGLKVAPDGTVYVHVPGRLWRSDDGGASFKTVSFAFGVNPCGCDADVAIDNEGNLFYSDLALNIECVAVAASMNKGTNWIPDPVACGPDGGFVDRQWIESDGGSNLWLSFYGGPGLSLARAPLAPAPVFVSVQSGYSGGDFVQWNGYLAVDRASGAVYASYNTIGDDVIVQRTLDGGLSLERVVVARDRGDTFDSFTVPAVDDAGNVYMVWTERVEPTPGNAVGTDTYFSSSSDQGKTWRAPVKVNRAPFTTTFPWIVAGADGRVGIVYYGSLDKTEPNQVRGDWYVYYAHAADATAASPAFTEVLAVPHKVKTGPICTAGTGCGNTREFLDFFAVAAMPDGHAAVAFNDQTGLSPGQSPWVKFVKQTGGPRLRDAAPPSPEPPVLPMPPLALGLDGTEPLPPSLLRIATGLHPHTRGTGLGAGKGVALRHGAGMEL